MKEVKDKLVLITGGASGIGRLMALDFAGRGARVAVWDINRQNLEAVSNEGRKQGLFIKSYVCDVSRREEMYRSAEQLTKELGPVDILVNNAGIVSGKPLLEIPDEKIESTMAVNVLPLFWTVKAFLPSMLERNSGHIVTVSSAAGIIGVRGLSDYSASKFAAFGFNESLRMELRHRKSRVKTTVACPFFINTGMFDGVKTRVPLLLPVLKPEYVSGMIVKSVLKNKKVLIMPRFAKTTLILRCFPVGLIDFAAEFFGINNAMDEFRGRKTTEF
ncbi:MAG: SDR family oxidoreductase [Treponema sp.]|jgi:all-trans-retinol dehydrogenase (NAD+)|nr:SDR family oxidoreductase [Treponema sp.]